MSEAVTQRCRRLVAAWLGGHQWDWKTWWATHDPQALHTTVYCLKCGKGREIWRETDFTGLH